MGIGAEPSPEEFFETRVRPVLARNCFSCHSASKLGGFRLDSRKDLLAGGKSGPAIVVGNSAHSTLIQAVEYAHSRLKMPPSGKLRAEEIADLRKWIDTGAPWPEVIVTKESSKFWSFQPVRKSPVPVPKDRTWAKTDIDRFLLARLEAEGMRPAKPADKRVLLRRVTFDLTGLPPTPEEMAAFVADKSPDAFEKVVNRLLASPHYGERWARHWLDLARYSDGQQGARDDTPYPNAFRYRDWVIESLNADMSYDLFVKAQIAADHMPAEMHMRLLPGLGFQTLGESNVDRLDVTTRVFLGLTVGCAQCHDHKFDPIPTRDYYSLLGVFQSSKEAEHPLVEPGAVELRRKSKKAHEDKQAELKLFLDRQVSQVIDILAARTEHYLIAAAKLISDPNLTFSAVANAGELDGETLERWLRYSKVEQRDHNGVEHWDKLVRRLRIGVKVDDQEVRSTAREVAARVREVLAEKHAVEDRNYVKLGGLEGKKDTDKVISTLVEALPIEKYYFWRDMASNPYKVEDLKFDGGIYYYGPKEVERFLPGHWKTYLDTLRSEVKLLEEAVPPSYPFWHVLKDVEKPANAKVAIRGNEANLGEEAPRQFLSVLCDGAPQPFRHGSGRLDLAEAIASPTNPLTARVMVNRIWKHHFGEGLVRSASNFGQLGDRPTHPELLDYLAAKFVESGWSIKAMHRQMLLSAAYQMSSSHESAAKDPENRLLSHAAVQERMDAESVRDSVLAIAGTLDRTIGGPPVSPSDENRRRTIYSTVSRSKPDRTMALFDFPDPNTSSEQRIVTVGPMQRLFFLNSKFIAQQSKALSARILNESSSDESRIFRVYELMFGRPATPEEVRLGLEFVSGQADSWPKYVHALFGTAEFSTIQ